MGSTPESYRRSHDGERGILKATASGRLASAAPPVRGSPVRYSCSCVALNVRRQYNLLVIRSFRDRETDKVFRREFRRKFQSVAAAAKRRLDQVHAAAVLSDLAAVPGNRLHALSGDRIGRHAIRVNEQRRICFRWVDADAVEVEIVDYH